ncbi:MAG TPA: nucleotidyltransferase domain-containing protein [Blastocatellia bacterium]|nr:nucleotidyltransferase domain-containing protein [Blastocatellia bacterium]
MNPLNNIPLAKQETLRRAVDALKKIEGVAAIVLGGSYARGTHHAESDLDLGIYYSPASPFAIESIRQVAQELSDNDHPAVTDFYGWGPWVNGGAWIQTKSGKVDLIYRNLEQVERTIEEAINGIWHHHYDQQPTFGFYSVIYLAETKVCIPLSDSDQVIARLKQSVQTYPPKLRQKIVVDTLWGAEFALWFARQYAAAGDVYNTVGCITRITGYLTQALFALNTEYYISDKKVMDAIAQFEHRPANYVERVNQILAYPGATSEELVSTVNNVQAVWHEAVELAGEMYQSKFILGN